MAAVADIRATTVTVPPRRLASTQPPRRARQAPRLDGLGMARLGGSPKKE